MAFDRWGKEAFDFDAYEGRLRRAIELWEEALPLIPTDHIQTRALVLDRLARGWFELASGYFDTNAEMDEAYGRGKDYALESLMLDPEFRRLDREEGRRAALQAATDIVALFWYGNDLGSWLNYRQLTALTGGSGMCSLRSSERSRSTVIIWRIT